MKSRAEPVEQFADFPHHSNPLVMSRRHRMRTAHGRLGALNGRRGRETGLVVIEQRATAFAGPSLQTGKFVAARRFWLMDQILDRFLTQSGPSSSTGRNAGSEPGQLDPSSANVRTTRFSCVAGLLWRISGNGSALSCPCWRCLSALSVRRSQMCHGSANKRLEKAWKFKYRMQARPGWCR